MLVSVSTLIAMQRASPVWAQERPAFLSRDTGGIRLNPSESLPASLYELLGLIVKAQRLI
jgi:hypothetical protein